MKKIKELLVGNSIGMQKIRKLIYHCARTNLNVLIIGEEGSGKSLIARALHEASSRSNNLFYQFDCSYINHQYIEKELFGNDSKKGIIELVNGGAIIFDHIDQLQLSIQNRIFSLLIRDRYSVIGSKEMIKSHFQCIATSNQELEERVHSGLLRKDLYYSMNIIKIEVPPLRSRQEDIEPLIFHFLSDMNIDSNEFINKLSDRKMMEYLHNYHWPGNVKELKQIVDTLYMTDDWGDVRDKLEKNNIRTNRIILKRTIEFPPQYHQAGLNILSYFQTILRNKDPNMNVKVKIVQQELRVTMIIESPNGEIIEKVEKTLEDYGLVVRDKMEANEFFENDRLSAIELSAQLGMIKTQLETQKLILEEKNRLIAEKKIEIQRQHDLNLGFQKIMQLAFEHKPDINFTPSIIQSNSTDVSQITTIKLSEAHKNSLHSILNKISEKIDDLKLDRINKENLIQNIKDSQNDMKEKNISFWSLKQNLLSINNLLQGAAGSLLASELLPQFQNIMKGILG